MHTLDIETVEMTLDVMKYAIGRITNQNPELGHPKTEAELLNLVGETITPKGIGGEKALQLFRDILVKATVPIDHPRHLAFVPAAPTRAAVLFDLVTSASSIHGAYWMEGAGGIFQWGYRGEFIGYGNREGNLEDKVSWSQKAGNDYYF